MEHLIQLLFWNADCPIPVFELPLQVSDFIFVVVQDILKVIHSQRFELVVIQWFAWINTASTRSIVVNFWHDLLEVEASDECLILFLSRLSVDQLILNCLEVLEPHAFQEGHIELATIKILINLLLWLHFHLKYLSSFLKESRIHASNAAKTIYFFDDFLVEISGCINVWLHCWNIVYISSQFYIVIGGVIFWV